MNIFGQEKGFTLIELMIGLLVGLIVLSAVIYTFLSTLRSSKDIVNSARLNKESSTLGDLISGELRRTGYYPVSLVVSGSDIGFGAGRQDLYVSPNCVAFSYYDDRIASVADRGFYWNGSNAISYGSVAALTSTACAALSDNLNDPNKVAVDAFNAELICIETSTQLAASSSECMAATASGTYSRAVSLAVDMSIVDDDWTTTLNEYVKLPNDLSP